MYRIYINMMIITVCVRETPHILKLGRLADLVAEKLLHSEQPWRIKGVR